MAPNDDPPEETFLETEEGSAGEAQRMPRTRGLADDEAPLSEDELDARQASIGERRRQGGPPLDAPATRGLRELPQEEQEDVPPTETEEPPEE